MTDIGECGMLTQNDMIITAMRSKSKPNKDERLKTKHCSLVVPVVSPGCYSNVRACVSAGVAQLHNLLNCGTGILYTKITGRFYGYVTETAGSVCLKL